jgi:hypothetical protein
LQELEFALQLGEQFRLAGDLAVQHLQRHPLTRLRHVDAVEVRGFENHAGAAATEDALDDVAASQNLTDRNFSPGRATQRLDAARLLRLT